MRRLSGIVVLAVAALAAPQARAVDKKVIDEAVERGIAGLRRLQQGDGSWPSPNGGMTGLAAVTLLECEVPAKDPAIQKAAEFVRKEAIDTKHVYTICTSIFFLDRLGEPVDVPLLEALTVRLLSGQYSDGGWYYFTPAPPEDEKKRLKDHYESSKGKKLPPRPAFRKASDLAPEIKQRLYQIRPLPAGSATTDHSNTQFGSLALWVGRRVGVPVDGAIAMVDSRYRRSQRADGGWGYTLEPGSDTRASTTCAGVLGLSVQAGMVLSTGKALGPNSQQILDPTRDANLRAALARLAREVDLPPSVKKQPAAKLFGTHYYFLWSLERIMVAMDQEKLGGKDWYAWGSELLLANQQSDGTWQGEYGAYGADTCFALLFLVKANLAGDLTNLLKKKLTLSASGSLDKPLPPDPKKDPKKDPSTGETRNSKPTPETPIKPPPETRGAFTQARSATLAESLVRAPSAKQGQVLDQLRDGKGVEFTEALAGAIPQLDSETKGKARDALAQRLTRMKADTLARYLKDDDSEIRRAAALASGTREFKDQVPQLIELLTDPDQGVVLAAHTALKAMTGQKIGPTPEPWRTWWKQNGMNKKD